MQCRVLLDGDARADALEVGTYAIALEIEDSTYTVECTVVEELGASGCTQPMRVAGDVDFFVMFELAFDSGAPPHGFMMRAWEEDGERSLRGPGQVAITISHEEMPIADIAYDLEYVRDPAFWGDRKCGYCDLPETRSLTWQ
jgi:hypothetical protein